MSQSQAAIELLNHGTHETMVGSHYKKAFSNSQWGEII